MYGKIILHITYTFIMLYFLNVYIFLFITHLRIVHNELLRQGIYVFDTEMC